MARTHNGAKTVSSMSGVRRTGLVCTKKMKQDHQHIPHTKIKPKWIKDLNVSYETIKILEENIVSKISDTRQENTFAAISPKALETKQKINKLDYIKLKSFCTAKETISKMNREPTVWENIFTSDTSDKG